LVRLLVRGGERQMAACGGDSGETKEEEGLGGPLLGRNAVVTWDGVGISNEKSRPTAMAIGPN
jgi:hypothetical protein